AKHAPSRAQPGFWEQLERVMAADSHRGIQMAEAVILRSIKASHFYLPLAELAPSLRMALDSKESATKQIAVRLIHALGEAGAIDFRDLLSPGLDEAGGH